MKRSVLIRVGIYLSIDVSLQILFASINVNYSLPGYYKPPASHFRRLYLARITVSIQREIGTRSFFKKLLRPRLIAIIRLSTRRVSSTKKKKKRKNRDWGKRNPFYSLPLLPQSFISDNRECCTDIFFTKLTDYLYIIVDSFHWETIRS